MKKYILLLSLSLTLFSCKGFLDQEPVLKVNEKTVYKDIDGLEKSLTPAYGILASSGWYGSGFILRAELATPNAARSKEKDTGRLKEEYFINYHKDNAPRLWQLAYRAMLPINTIIGKADSYINENSTDADKLRLNSIKAQAYFLRALAYFDLCRLFAWPYNHTADASHLGVPIVTTVQSSENLLTHSQSIARASVKEVYEQIINDLTEAEKLFSPSYKKANVIDPKAEVSLPAIYALLSRVYLYKQEWQKAADYATKVIDYTVDGNKQFRLWNVDELKGGKIFGVDIPSEGEIIFEVYSDKTNSDHPGARDGLSDLASPKGYGDAAATKWLYDIYEQGDIRKTMFVNVGLQPYMGEEQDLWTAKWLGKGLNKEQDPVNTPIFRLSEMYLIRAEAQLHGATVQGHSAADDMKTLAESRNASPLEATLENLYLERAKELAWEGHLWFDLLRTGREMQRGNNKEAHNYLSLTDYRWISPIPAHEMELNNKLIQNENY